MGEQRRITIRVPLGQVAVSLIPGYPLVIYGLKVQDDGLVWSAIGSAIVAVVCVVAWLMLTARTVLDGDTLTAVNVGRRTSFRRSEIVGFDVPEAHVHGANSITLVPVLGPGVRLPGTTRWKPFFREMAPLGERLTSWSQGG